MKILICLTTVAVFIATAANAQAQVTSFDLPETCVHGHAASFSASNEISVETFGITIGPSVIVDSPPTVSLNYHIPLERPQVVSFVTFQYRNNVSTEAKIRLFDADEERFHASKKIATDAQGGTLKTAKYIVPFSGRKANKSLGVTLEIEGFGRAGFFNVHSLCVGLGNSPIIADSIPEELLEQVDKFIE